MTKPLDAELVALADLALGRAFDLRRVVSDRYCCPLRLLAASPRSEVNHITSGLQLA
jgi:hypothetical protein